MSNKVTFIIIALTIILSGISLTFVIDAIERNDNVGNMTELCEFEYNDEDYYIYLDDIQKYTHTVSYSLARSFESMRALSDSTYVYDTNKYDDVKVYHLEVLKGSKRKRVYASEIRSDQGDNPTEKIKKDFLDERKSLDEAWELYEKTKKKLEADRQAEIEMLKCK